MTYSWATIQATVDQGDFFEKRVSIHNFIYKLSCRGIQPQKLHILSKQLRVYIHHKCVPGFWQHTRNKTRSEPAGININSAQFLHQVVGIILRAYSVFAHSCSGGEIKESHICWPDRQHNSGGSATNNTCAHHSGELSQGRANITMLL